MSKTRKRPGRPRLQVKAQNVTVYLGQKHIKAIERYRKAYGYPNTSAALRGILEDEI